MKRASLLSLLTIASFAACFLLPINPVHGQEVTEGEPDILTIGAGVGVISFIGDMSLNSELSPLTNVRPSFSFGLERRFGNYLGVSIDGLMGKVAHSQRSAVIADNLNFESPITQIGLSAAFHFDNDAIINRKSIFSPYISAGVAYTMFDPHGDLKDANGNNYYYWTDGAIMDRPEADDTLGNAMMLNRDYTYETQLTDSANNYSRNTLAFPLTFGLKWKMSERVQGRITGTYTLTQSDFIDNYSVDGKNDKYFNFGFSMHVTLRKANKTEQIQYEGVDFADLSSGDADGDGVKDFNDDCPATPKGIKVNGKGCPLDDDKDGVPNHLDRESGTAKGMPVDQYGITVDSTYLARQAAARDSVKTVRSQAFAENPNLETLQQFDRTTTGGGTPENTGTTSNLPAEFREADTNEDGVIQAKEITATIDRFFEGTSSFTVARIQDLIDYFFEQ